MITPTSSSAEPGRAPPAGCEPAGARPSPTAAGRWPSSGARSARTPGSRPRPASPSAARVVVARPARRPGWVWAWGSPKLTSIAGPDGNRRAFGGGAMASSPSRARPVTDVAVTWRPAPWRVDRGSFGLTGPTVPPIDIRHVAPLGFGLGRAPPPDSAVMGIDPAPGAPSVEAGCRFPEGLQGAR